MIIGYARDLDTEQQDALVNLGGVEALYQGPALAAALARTRAGDTLVVWRLAEVAHSLSSLIAVADTLRERGAHLRSMSEAIDTTVDKGLFNAVQVLAQVEREFLGEKIAAGIAQARAAGRGKSGRRLKLTPKQVSQIQWLLAYTRTPPKDVAAMYGVARSTLYRHLIDPGLNRSRINRFF